jgi:hypothetical protein
MSTRGQDRLQCGGIPNFEGQREVHRHGGGDRTEISGFVRGDVEGRERLALTRHEAGTGCDRLATAQECRNQKYAGCPQSKEA